MMLPRTSLLGAIFRSRTARKRNLKAAGGFGNGKNFSRGDEMSEIKLKPCPLLSSCDECTRKYWLAEVE